MVLFVTFFLVRSVLFEPSKSTKKWGANRPNEKLCFSIFWVFRDVCTMCYAVGILLNICACNLTSELAGRNLKYYIDFHSEINPSSKHRSTNFFNQTIIAWCAVVDWCGVLFELSTELKLLASKVFINIARTPSWGVSDI